MTRSLAYWIPTALFSLAFTGSGLMMLSQAPEMLANVERLGYPAHLTIALGLAKLAGVLVLLSPGLPRLKEWAYAGFAINLGMAAYAHLAAGDAVATIAPIGVLSALLAASWWTRPHTRALGELPSLARPAAPHTA